MYVGTYVRIWLNSERYGRHASSVLQSACFPGGHLERGGGGDQVHTALTLTGMRLHHFKNHAQHHTLHTQHPHHTLHTTLHTTHTCLRRLVRAFKLSPSNVGRCSNQIDVRMYVHTYVPSGTPQVEQTSSYVSWIKCSCKL